MLKKFLLGLSLILLIIVCAVIFPRYKKGMLIYYNEHFANHTYTTVRAGEKFIIAMEPVGGDNFKPPVFLKQLLEKAFADYEIIYDDNAEKPDLIVRDRWISNKDTKFRGDVIVPYMTISGEPDSLSIRKYKPYGFPFAELVSAAPSNERELYFPFIGWGEIKIIEPRPNNLQTAEKSVVYVSSHCIAERDKFFALLKKSKLTSVDSFGACSNPQKITIPGYYAADALKQVYTQYYFVFAMENSQKPGYITEKIVNAFNSGAIPIYWGDNATVEKLFNKDAFVNVGNFPSLEAAAEYIEELIHDNVRMQAIHDAPLFYNGVKSDLLKLDEKNNPYVLEQAKKLRILYDKYLAKHKTTQKNN